MLPFIGPGSGVPSQHFPVVKFRRLATQVSLGGKQIPHGCLQDAKALAGFGNTDAGIIINKTLCRDCCQEARAFFPIGRFGRESRGRLGQFLPGHLPEGEGGAIPVMQNRVCFRTVRNQYERRVENGLRQFRRRKNTGQKGTPGPVPETVFKDLGEGDDVVALPDGLHEAMVRILAPDGNLFCRLA